MKRAHPDVPNVLNRPPQAPPPPEKVRFSFRVDAPSAEHLPELEDRVTRYLARGARYDNTKVVKTLSLEPRVHTWLKEEAERCGMPLGKFIWKLLNDEELAAPPDPRDFDKYPWILRPKTWTPPVSSISTVGETLWRWMQAEGIETPEGT